jgi:hypothetical protein
MSISHNALRPPPRSSSFNYPLAALDRNNQCFTNKRGS